MGSRHSQDVGCLFFCWKELLLGTCLMRRARPDRKGSSGGLGDVPQQASPLVQEGTACRLVASVYFE